MANYVCMYVCDQISKISIGDRVAIFFVIVGNSVFIEPTEIKF